MFLLSLKFFTVDDDYIQHLKKTDTNVPDNYSSQKPFIGVLFNVNGLDYIAPLTSPKAKHSKIKNSSQTSFKVYEDNSNKVLLCIIQLNNMIPVKKSCISQFDVTSLGLKYQFLLLKEINYIRTHQEKLMNKANKLYQLITVKKIPALMSFSCDFLALETACNDFHR